MRVICVFLFRYSSWLLFWTAFPLHFPGIVRLLCIINIAYPNPKCKNNILLPKYITVVIIVKYFNFGTVLTTSALAITNESMEPFSPMMPTSNINDWNANTESTLTHFSPYSMKRTFSEYLHPKPMQMKPNMLIIFTRAIKVFFDSSSVPLE